MTRWITFNLAMVLAGGLACAPTPSTAPEAAPGSPQAPRYGGELNTSLEREPNDWDMRDQGKSGDNVAIHELVYDTLLGFRTGPGTEYMSQELVPRLAERWEAASDAKSFTFFLRKGVKFGNVPPANGREFTSADAKFSMEYYSSTGGYTKANRQLAKPKSQMEWMYQGIDGIDTPDPYTVRVRFKEPFAPFVSYAASRWMPMAAVEVLQQEGSLSNTLVGTGPYLFDAVESQKGTRWVVKKNPDYWEEEKPYLDGVRRLILPEVATQMAAFQTKQLDLLLTTNFKDAESMKKASPQALSSAGRRPMGKALWISHLRGGPLTDVRVRRAISLGLNRDEFNSVLYGGQSAWSLAGAWDGLFSDEEIKQMVKYDPVEAKRLLKEAGYPSGPVLENIVTQGAGAQDPAVLLAQAQLKKIGVHFELTVLPRELHRPRLYSGDYDFYNHSGGGSVEADVDSTLFASYHSASTINWSGVKDPELDQLLLATRRETDAGKRRDALRAAVRRINEMAYNPALVYPVEFGFWHPHVKNFRPHFSQGEHNGFAWLEK